MAPTELVLRASSLLPGRALHVALGNAAYRRRRWRLAHHAFSQALRRGEDRSTWLRAGSAADRMGRADLRDRCTAAMEERFPSACYDSRAALAVSTKRPLERDAIAVFAAERADELRERAESLVESATAGPAYAFVYWDTEDRPDVVRRCIAAMRQHLPADLVLVELSAANLGDWITIDPRILDAVDIPAHEADVIRLHLLSTYGGLWLDASCLIGAAFGGFYDGIREEDLFLFTYAGSRTGNWFIRAEARSYRLQLVRAALDAWFLSGRGWTNYFQFHDVVEMLYWTDERYRREWDAGRHTAPTGAFDLQRTLGRSVSDAEWAAVRSRNPVNKLSWRKYNAPELRSDPTTGIARLIAELDGSLASA